MPQMDFFPQRPEVHPMIYAYRDLNPDYDGLLKVGYTEKDVDRRVAQQYPTKRPDGKLPYEILYRSSAMREDGSCFTDHDVHVCSAAGKSPAWAANGFAARWMSWKRRCWR